MSHSSFFHRDRFRDGGPDASRSAQPGSADRWARARHESAGASVPARAATPSADRVIPLLLDEVREVRAAAIAKLSEIVGSTPTTLVTYRRALSSTVQQALFREQDPQLLRNVADLAARVEVPPTVRAAALLRHLVPGPTRLAMCALEALEQDQAAGRNAVPLLVALAERSEVREIPNNRAYGGQLIALAERSDFERARSVQQLAKQVRDQAPAMMMSALESAQVVAPSRESIDRLVLSLLASRQPAVQEAATKVLREKGSAFPDKVRKDLLVAVGIALQLKVGSESIRSSLLDVTHQLGSIGAPDFATELLRSYATDGSSPIEQAEAWCRAARIDSGHALTAWESLSLLLEDPSQKHAVRALDELVWLLPRLDLGERGAVVRVLATCANARNSEVQQLALGLLSGSMPPLPGAFEVLADLAEREGSQRAGRSAQQRIRALDALAHHIAQVGEPEMEERGARIFTYLLGDMDRQVAQHAAALLRPFVERKQLPTKLLLLALRRDAVADAAPAVGVALSGLTHGAFREPERALVVEALREVLIRARQQDGKIAATLREQLSVVLANAGAAEAG